MVVRWVKSQNIRPHGYVVASVLSLGEIDDIYWAPALRGLSCNHAFQTLLTQISVGIR